LDAVNIQTKYITRMLCSFLAAAVSVNSVRRFLMTGIYLIKDDDQVLCMVRPDQGK
jgi:hypothetical protein